MFEAGWMSVDPAYYVSQIVFFVWSAVLLGFFIRGVTAEVAANGWASSGLKTLTTQSIML